jgi:hypothetical protein
LKNLLRVINLLILKDNLKEGKREAIVDKVASLYHTKIQLLKRKEESIHLLQEGK